MELVLWGLQAGRDPVAGVTQGFGQIPLSLETCKKKKKKWDQTPGFPPHHTMALLSVVLLEGTEFRRSVSVCVICECNYLCVHAFTCAALCVCMCVCEPRSGPGHLPGLVQPVSAPGLSGGGQLANEEGTGMPCSSGLLTIPTILGLLASWAPLGLCWL